MKVQSYCKAVMLIFAALFFFSMSAHAQGVADPASMNVFKALGTITVDGNLSEAEWNLNTYPYLIFRANGKPSGYGNTPTGGTLVKPNPTGPGPQYKDSTTTIVKLLWQGMKLYGSLQSDDKQVCSFGQSWEGDGIFMKVKNAANADKEVKLYFDQKTLNADMLWDSGPQYGTGKGVKGSSTISEDSSNVDNGYTAEFVIYLDSLGYTTPPATLPVNIVIFDPDNYSVGVAEWSTNGNFYKQWWGSEWGTDRSITLVNSTVPVELTSFTASLKGNAVLLNWNTATESNNKGFEVERSADNTRFTKIAYLAGNGTTLQARQYSYVDNSIKAGQKYYYRVKQVDFNGQFKYSSSVEVVSNPARFNLSQNYPNPFNPATSIRFDLPVASKVTVQIFDMLGRLVSTAVQSQFEAGSHSVNFNAVNLTSGVYVYKLNAEGIDGQNFSMTRKMSLLK